MANETERERPINERRFDHVTAGAALISHTHTHLSSTSSIINTEAFKPFTLDVNNSEDQNNDVVGLWSLS